MTRLSLLYLKATYTAQLTELSQHVSNLSNTVQSMVSFPAEALVCFHTKRGKKGSGSGSKGPSIDFSTLSFCDFEVKFKSGLPPKAQW